MFSTRSPVVLLVEDEPGDTRLMQLALKKTGLNIDLHCVADGNEALVFLKSRAVVRPDLILLDLKMPGMGGLETLQALKQEGDWRGIPVVIVTTSGLEADVAAAYRLGAAGFVPKPADLGAFMVAVETLCQYWFRLVRLPEQDND